MQGIIKIRGAPIDGCPDEQKKLSMKNRPLVRPKALAVFLCLNSNNADSHYNQAPTTGTRGGFMHIALYLSTNF